MFFPGLTKDDDVVEIHQREGDHVSSEGLLRHESLEGARRVFQPKRHDFKTVGSAVGSRKGRVLSRLWVERDLPVSGV